MSGINEYEYQQIHDKRIAESICVAATVKVTSFDPAKMTVDVQPLSKHLQNGKYESQPPILGVPVACTRCGGFITRPWIKAGDTGVVVYLDHDMDSTVTGGKEAKPLTERNHATTDAIFIGAIVAGGYSSSGLPSDSLVLATESGGIYVAVSAAGITIKGDLTVNGKITASGDVLAENSISGAHHTHPGCSGGSTGQPG